VYQVLFIVGVNLTNAANSAVILGTIPVWIALEAHFFTDEKLNFLKIGGIFFAFLGVSLIIFGAPMDSLSSRPAR
jgi:drug/metabolite transporter (DMT)-like permease